MRKAVFLSLVIVYTMSVYSHEGEEHADDEGWEIISREPTKEQLRKINHLYISNVKPIFQKKCFDCHGSGNKKPWYYVVPGVKQLLEYDIKESKKHMDMSSDFPFKGHGNAKDDLEQLVKTIDKDSMPIFRYKILHWDSSLTETEKNIVKNWVSESLEIIKNKGEDNENK